MNRDATGHEPITARDLHLLEQQVLDWEDRHAPDGSTDAAGHATRIRRVLRDLDDGRSSPLLARAAACALVLTAAESTATNVQRLLGHGVDPQAERGLALTLAIDSNHATDPRRPAFQVLLAAGIDPNDRFADIVLDLSGGIAPDAMRAAAIDDCLRHGADPFRRAVPRNGSRPHLRPLDGAKPEVGIVAAVYRIPVNAVPLDIGDRHEQAVIDWMRRNRQQSSEEAPLLIEQMLHEPVCVDRMVAFWQADPDRQTWAVDLLASHLDEPWAVRLLARMGDRL